MRDNESHNIDNSQSNNNVSCDICGRGFTTNRGLLRHLNACSRNKKNSKTNKREK